MKSRTLLPALLPALLLAALSGAAGLAHQLLWVRRMVDILGADAGTFSRVVAAFFLGLSLGAWFAARTRTPRPWLAVAAAEGVVAMLAGLVLAAGQWTFSSLSPALDWLLPCVLILPPAFAMGAVMPWMIRACGPAASVPIYTVNTLGGIAGIAAVALWALPALGLSGASLLALTINAGLAGTALILDRRSTTPSDSFPTTGGRIGDPLVRQLAFGSGFLVLASEVVLQNQFAQVLVSSHLSSALVLALVLASLGFASLLCCAITTMSALTVSIALAAAAFAAQPFLFIVNRGGMHYIPFEKPPAEYFLAALSLGLPAIGLVLLPAGLIFPLLLRSATAAGTDAGRLLCLNGLGGWLGAEIAARALLPTFGLWRSMAVLAAGYIIALLFTRSPLRWPLTAALVALLAFAWRVDGRLPHVGLLGADRVEQIALGREGIVAVVTSGKDDWRLLLNNTYTLGGTRSQTNQERETLLPMLLHGDARRVATLGVATGSTLSGALMDPWLETIEGIELSPLVLAFAKERFSRFTHNAPSDKRTVLTQGDARRVIAARDGRFDVIVGDLFLPWSTGEARLFTREHFENVRAALAPGGLFCQWLPMYQLTRPQFETILRTFRAVFPDAWILRGDFYTSMPIIGLVGGRSLSGIDWSKVAGACARIRTSGQCRDPLLRHAEGVAMFVVGPAPSPPPGPLNTLANSWLEWDAARNVIGLREPWFNGVPLAEALRLSLRESRITLPAPFEAARHSGDMLLALEIARAARLSQAAALEETWNRELPEALRIDPDADWSLLPMRFPPRHTPR